MVQPEDKGALSHSLKLTNAGILELDLEPSMLRQGQHDCMGHGSMILWVLGGRRGGEGGEGKRGERGRKTSGEMRG